MKIKKTVDLTEGSIPKKLLLFAMPLMAGNILQQLYNIVDTVVVGKYLGEDALAAVGSAYTIMILITSVIIGLCMGSSVYFSVKFGQKDETGIRQSFFISFIGIFVVTAVLIALAYALLYPLIYLLNIPAEIQPMFHNYMLVVFAGIFAIFLYNIFANLLRAVGNSVIPLAFLAVSAVTNIALDLLFILQFKWGVVGAAAATVIAQYLSGIGIMIYYFVSGGNLRVKKADMKWDKKIFKELASLSSLTCIQQSIMNFGILMVQGLVNSFGTAVMAAFAAGVKIDTLAYSPVQDFGNAFSTYVAQNYGAGKKERISRGMKDAVLSAFVFCFLISTLVVGFAKPLMGLFLKEESAEAIAIGAGYLHIEAAFYFGIGLLFLFYGYYRAVHKPGISVVLTVISLGTRVVLAYALSSIEAVGVTGIWMSVPIGWVLADLAGAWYYFRRRE